MKKLRQMRCNGQCFSCVYPDCIKESGMDKESIVLERQIKWDGLSEQDKRDRESAKRYYENHKDKIREYKKAYASGVRKRPHKKAVVQKTYDGKVIAVYESSVEAARQVNGKWRMIGKACRGDNTRGRLHGAYGYEWYFKE